MEHELIKGFVTIEHPYKPKRCSWCKWWAECEKGQNEIDLERKTGITDGNTIAGSCRKYKR